MNPDTRDDPLGKLYREAGQPEPPAWLDARILGAAGRSTGAHAPATDPAASPQGTRASARPGPLRPAWRRFGWLPLAGSLATAVLAVLLVTGLPVLRTPLQTVPQSPAPSPAPAPAPSPSRSPSPAPAPAAAPAAGPLYPQPPAAAPKADASVPIGPPGTPAKPAPATAPSAAGTAERSEPLRDPTAQSAPAESALAPPAARPSVPPAPSPGTSAGSTSVEASASRARAAAPASPLPASGDACLEVIDEQLRRLPAASDADAPLRDLYRRCRTAYPGHAWPAAWEQRLGEPR